MELIHATMTTRGGQWLFCQNLRRWTAQNIWQTAFNANAYSSEEEESKNKLRSESKRSVLCRHLSRSLVKREDKTDFDFQREESIAKRRNFQPVEDELESEDETELPGNSLGETLPGMLQAIQSDNSDAQLDATMKFRK